MSTRVEQVVKQLADWSPNELRELKTWMEGELAPAEAKDKCAAIDRIFGKYAHISTSAEDFCARKTADLELETHSLAGCFAVALAESTGNRHTN